MRITSWILTFVALLLGVTVFIAAPAQAQTVNACDISNAPANCGGMWALQVNLDVPNGAYAHVPDPGCMNDATGDIARVLQAAIVTGEPELAIISGPLSSAIAGPVNDYLRNQGGDIGRLFSPYSRNAALCANLVGTIPVRATYVGYRLLATDAENGNNYSECTPGNDCPIGWSKYAGEPSRNANEKVQIISAMFMNWSHNRPRKARMVVFFTLPPGERMAIRM